MNQENETHRGSWAVAIVLVFCVLLVGFWEIMRSRSSKSWEAFDLTAEDFARFQPESREWRVRRLPARSSPTEPNILAYEIRKNHTIAQPHDDMNGGRNHDSIQVSGFNQHSPPAILLRLVHGYNMPDCMKLKRYEVELIGDYRKETPHRGSERAESKKRPNSELQGQDVEQAAMPLVQLWRLTSDTGDVSIWVTGMIRAHDFSQTDIDVRSMAFPRVEYDEIGQDFSLRGVTGESLKNPIGSFRKFLRARWNSSRSDLLTFLGLKQPAWASREALTLVALAVRPPGAGDGSDEELATHVIEAYEFMLSELQEFAKEM